MKALIAAVLVACITAGCATQIESEQAAGPAIRFQTSALRPGNGGELIRAEALQPGDIILTATNGITSAGIRLVTVAPVSHAALYLGDGDVAEAVGSGVRIRKLDAMLDDDAVAVAFRHPQLQSDHGVAMRRFAEASVGSRYDYVGVMLHAPFSLQRRVCELPLVPAQVREGCLRGIASIQLGTKSNDRFFCSEFVLQAYQRAGMALTDANPKWISPADILHMREGDVPSLPVRQSLVYIGHLKYRLALDEGVALAGKPQRF